VWSQKHKPKNLEEAASGKLAEDIRGYGWKKPLIIYGPTGSGKSALVEALAADRGFELVEVTDDNLEAAKDAAQTASIFGNKKLLYLDNVDQFDKIKVVPEILENAKNPVVMTTSDFSSKRIATIKKMSEKLQLRKPTAKAVEKILHAICAKEGVECEPAALEKIAENAGGDIRSAINDLETLAKGRKNVSAEDAAILSKRDTSVSIYDALGRILTKKDLGEAVRVMYDLDEQPKDVLLWIDENLPYIYSTKEDIGRAYENISKADLFIGRIARRQYWGLLRYANTLMSGGVNVSKKSNVRFSMFRFPSYLITMSQTKKDRGMKKSIGEKLSPRLHVSGKTVAREYIPLFRTLLSKGRVGADELALEYRLSEEEIEYLQPQAPDDS
jgi:replication factor C large subunit